ncbi:hypothetical protein [Tissierella sp.]|uniref:hypothetical protein n=1 Tax=Tissierella sp. TaxID=41274 RepID=UPI0028A96C9C|nr:hypothetical protein [Tissierella sp.]
MKAVRDDIIKNVFMTMWNKLISNYEYILELFLEFLRNLRTDKEELSILNNKIMELIEQSQILSRVVSKGYIESAVFIERQNHCKEKSRDYL